MQTAAIAADWQSVKFQERSEVVVGQSRQRGGVPARWIPRQVGNLAPSGRTVCRGPKLLVGIIMSHAPSGFYKMGVCGREKGRARGAGRAAGQKLKIGTGIAKRANSFIGLYPQSVSKTVDLDTPKTALLTPLFAFHPVKGFDQF
jgi:hypothetical protein